MRKSIANSKTLFQATILKFVYLFHEERLQNWQREPDREERGKHWYLAVTNIAASVGGTDDLPQQSRKRLANESVRGFQSLNRYNTSTRYYHLFKPCRRVLERIDMIIADFLPVSGLQKNTNHTR